MLIINKQKKYSYIILILIISKENEIESEKKKEIIKNAKDNVKNFLVVVVVKDGELLGVIS